ncbi:MAG: M23 family metallopeptidase [candidate division KSB1 bacterium]|nr:M23 family metallopeptidase [candidate division KSB1 bacterium]
MDSHLKKAHIVDNALPHSKENGRFWENRQDRFHCGMDLYAPPSSPVYAMETGRIVSIHPFTSPRILAYWNNTIAVVLEGESGYLYKYAELDSANVSAGARVQRGDMLGKVGSVLNVNQIDGNAPEYIQELKEKNAPVCCTLKFTNTARMYWIFIPAAIYFLKQSPNICAIPLSY